MQSTRWITGRWIGLALWGALAQAEAGQTPGVASPWNGPWGGGFLNGESYGPLANPYVGAGYPVAAPAPFGGAGGAYPAQPQQPMQAQPKPLPGGGFLLPPGAGGGMMPGAYANH
jgi:hypothetical protein